MKKHFFTLLAYFFILIGVCGPGLAATTFDNLVVFGDSLSDTGKFDGRRFSDGAIWVETLAENLGLALNNHAYAGATTDYDNPSAGLSYTGLLWQVAQYGSSSPTENSLVTVWAGANDLADERGYAAAANNIVTALGLLYDEGFRYFMVLNLPDIGNTPKLQIQGQSDADAASWWSKAFNADLAVKLTNFAEAYEGVMLYDLDIYAAFDEYTVNTQAWADLFWIDGYHPSSTGHAMIADIAASAVPVPQTALLLVSGLLGLALAGRKRRNAS
ncbi:SGNH/GDSL hydrolase family protein [uncultured Desulfobacter sp.]|uniref:SGNH/GDSL hydrolase family protein n=1 Tax=uncultured Desulfobacter sp. TaxID=240139 RepID=UPI0029F55D3A|nr:SGNH/GDSL hydrolase family protein [uncultured Desulfobacter sp.]